ncbi:MAG: hypothetical protein DMF56_12560 [Acidobacteria bacterium]|nr:MAG: hypothetical protein DMF56_12560 [Acidobacteriota bacterium]
MEHPPFAAWETFYVILGSAAAALTGLQFVVVVLGAEARAVTRGAIRAWGTPTIIHFGATLILSCMVSAPWRSIPTAATSLGIFGLAGLLYLIRVHWHARRQADYTPVFEDWLWHFVLPGISYFALLLVAFFLTRHTHGALFGAGGSALLLLIVGIHNAWDAVTYIALRDHEQQAATDPASPPQNQSSPAS